MNKPQYEKVVEDIFAHKYAFLGVFFVVLLVSYGFLFAIDFIPEAPDEVSVVEEVVVTDESLPPALEEEIAVDPLPVKMFIDALDKELTVLNPESRDIAELDAALLEGVVRHPDSADFADNGNMFLFGHSSYLPTVFNQNFKAFNGIQELEWGDVIRVQSGDTEYIYRVQRTYKALASQATVELDNSSSKLTLVTCNSFGSKDDRFIVEANLVDTRPL